MDVLKLDARRIQAKVDASLQYIRTTRFFQHTKNRPVIELLLSCRDLESRKTAEQLHLQLMKLYPFFHSPTLIDNTDENLGLLILLAYAVIKLAVTLEQELLSLDSHIKYSISYWKERQNDVTNMVTKRCWWIYETTPLFWFNYFFWRRGQYQDPTKELQFRLWLLQQTRRLNAIYIGCLHYLWSLSSCGATDLTVLVDQTLSLLEIYCARSKDVISSTIITLQKSASNVAPITKNRQADDEEEMWRYLGSNTKSTITDLFRRLCHISREVYICQYDLHEAIRVSKHPPWYSRNWLATIISACSIYNLGKAGYIQYNNLVNYLTDMKVLLVNFAKEHIWEPLVHIYETIRFNSAKVSLITEKALNESVASLGRMVANWNRDHSNYTPDMLEMIEEAARLGDISTIMRAYEKEIEHPIRNVVLGNVIRLALIQVQKQKVDLERAMLKIDKLLKQNELNFQLMAAVPAGIVLYLLYYLLTRDTNPYQITHERLRTLMRETAILLNRSLKSGPSAKIRVGPGDTLVAVPMTFENYGILLLLAFEMYKHAVLLSHSEQTWFLEDLQELCAADFEVTQRINTLQRMYGSYGFLAGR